MTATVRYFYPRVWLGLMISLMIACSWLIFPYLIQGEKLLSTAGENVRLTKAGNVSMYLTRYLVDRPELKLTATFATDEFFQYVDRVATIGELRPDKNFIFFVSENIHEGRLGSDIPDVQLHIGDNIYQADQSIGPSVAEHHRISIYSISKMNAEGEPIDVAAHGSIRLYVSNHYFGSEDKLTFVGRWEAPFDLPDELKSRKDITAISMLALGAGLLSTVLTPCLLQLVVIFATTISSLATVPGGAVKNSLIITSHIRRKVMQVSIAFVCGFTLLYTIAGAFVGHVGHRMQLVFAEYSRNVAIVSGVLIILIGVWIGIRGRRNFVCPIPDAGAIRPTTTRDIAGSLLVSIGYALGCMACFGGAIVATLIIYVGTIGSAAIGAGIMFTFSIGVAIPFLLAAFFVSRMNNVVVLLARNAYAISIASMLLIITFGFVLITDNFHVISDALYPYLGLN